MIAMFYYAREIDFSKMAVGDKITIPINGKYADEAVVTYLGPGNYSTGNENFTTHDLKFEYSYGGSLSGYQVQMKVGDKNPIPLFISASLPVGRVEMLYNP